MARRKIDFAISLQSNMSTDEPSSLPSSPTAADADITMELPYATPNYSLAIQSRRALTVRNALVASKLSSCSVETLLCTIEANASDGAAVEKDEFIEMVRILPELRSGEAFRPMEETLERIYRSFEAANRVDLYLLGIGCLPLIQGSVKEKLHGAIKLSLFGCGVPMDDPISLSVLKTALACLLLSITAVFDLDSATPEQLQSTSTIVTTSVCEAVARLFSFYSLRRDATATFDAQIWPWVETNATKACPWLKFVDQQKWPTTKRLTSPTKSDASSPRRWASQSSITSSQVDGVDSVGESQATTAATNTSVDQTALNIRFSDVDGGVLTISEEQATALFNLLTQSAFTKVLPKAMYDTFVQHTGDGLLEEETFLEAIEELLSMTNMPHLGKDSEFLDGMIDIFRCFLPENVLRVDAFEIAAGFSLFAWGSKSDKLGSAFHYFDADSKGFLNQEQLWRFLRSVLTILLYLSPPNAMVLQRHGSLAALVDTGEDKIMDSIVEGLGEEYGEYEDDDEDNSDDDDGSDSDGGRGRSGFADERALANSELCAGVFTFEDFGLWYNSGGFEGMSWLELLDLRKWMFVSPSFDVNLLDVQPVDPVYASSNYYTANNIQVDVDADNIDDLKDGANQFAFADRIVEEDDEDDDDGGGGGNAAVAPPQSTHNTQLDPPGNSQSSFGSSTSEQRPRSNSSIPSSLPVFCLKNEVVLEFDLTLDPDDDTLPELPLTTLSFNNGDLLMYAELQRVTKLQLVDLNRVYEVFAPLMERPGASSIEKSTFDRCVRQLLPRNVAGDVVAAFGVHTNTRIPPPSVGRGNQAKMAADTLSRLFFAFNRGGTGKIDLVEFVSAFSMFSAGTKSQKLGYAYSLFDADHDGSLTRREMWKYLRSFLTMLLALGNGSELSAEAIASVADATAIQIADTIFRDSGKTFSVRRASPQRGTTSHRRSFESADAPDLMTINRSRHNARGRYEHRGSLPDDDSIQLTGAAQSAAGAGAGNAFIRGGVVSFQEFATWYSTRGHIIIAWIELLDTRKWPEVSPPVADAILRYISRQQRVILPDSRADDDERDSGSSNDTESSTESAHFLRGGRNGSMDLGYPDTNMTIISAADMRAGANGNTALERMDGIGGIADLITSPPSSSSGMTKDLSSVALQFKLMNFDNTTLRIRLKDVAIVYTISERMNLSSMTCRDLVNLLNKYAQGRTLSKQGYLRAMRELVPRDVLSNEDQEFLSFHLLRIYTLFETESAGASDDSGRDNPEAGGADRGSSFMGEHDAVGAATTSSVDKLLVLSGLSIFCGTTKSAKLGTLFKVFDLQGRGSVSRRYLFELLKSILIVLFAFSSLNATRAHSNDTSTTDSSSTHSIAERAAGALISKIFCEASCRHHDVITLAEFAAWYAAGGYMDCPWLELLDLSKWPAKEAFEASKSEKHLICAFDLQDEGNILNFTETDMSTYLFVLRSTQLLDMSVSKIYDSLLAFATPPPDEAKKKKTAGLGRGQGYSYAGVEEDEGAYLVISRSNFYECIRSLVAKEHMTEKAQQTSSKLLSRIFNVFDRKRCGRVNALELACGMSILGKGSKSQKLALAFDFIARMRQQRTRTLNVYASAHAAAAAASASTGFGFGIGGGANGFGLGFGGTGGINSIATGGPTFGLPSTRGLGTAAMRRAPGAGPAAAAPSTSTQQQAQHEANALPHSVLFIYLRSFLLALMALSDGTYRLGIEKMFAEAEDVIEEAMGDLMTDVSATGSTATTATGTNAASMQMGFSGYGSVRSRASVTFEQFGAWYNTGGYQIISWVELLDVSKWQQEQDFQEQTASLAGGVGTARTMSRRIAVLGSQRPGMQPYPGSTATRSTTPILEHHVQPIESSYSAAKPFTQRKHVRQSEIVSTSYANGIQTVERRRDDGGDGGADTAPVARGADGTATTKDQRESIGALSLLSDGPILVFSVARQAAEIHFFHEDITRLRQFLIQTQVHRLAPIDFAAALQRALGLATRSSSSNDATTASAALVTRSHLIQSVELVCASRSVAADDDDDMLLPPPPASLSDDSMELLDQVLSVFVREPDAIKSGDSSRSAGGNTGNHTNDNTRPDSDDEDGMHDGSDLLEFQAAVCGLLVVCDGSLADKLACAAHVFAATKRLARDAQPATSVGMATLKTSLTCFLMAFYGMSSSLGADVVRFSAELGADDVLRSYEASLVASSSSDSDNSDSERDDDTRVGRRGSSSSAVVPKALDLSTRVSLRAFCDWFSDTGSHAHPWLELAELQSWPAPIHMGDADAR